MVRQHRGVISVALWLTLVLAFLLALSLGATPISLAELFQPDSYSSSVVQQIRLPRALLATLVGAILGMCGATSQGLFRNPLADPSLIGVTAGASAGAAMVIFFAGSWIPLQSMIGLSAISIGAFIGGAAAVLLVYRIATGANGTSVATMLLAGIAITALSGGLTSFFEYFADSEVLRRISLWRMGGLDGANLQRVYFASIFALIIVVFLPRYSTALNAMLLGESEARHLGVAVQKTKRQIIVLLAIGIAASVSLAGSIAFVGLVVPHIIRLLLGPDHKLLLPMSAVGGAILLLLADVVSRTVVAPIELPVGLVTAFLGAPFFISLLRKAKFRQSAYAH